VTVESIAVVGTGELSRTAVISAAKAGYPVVLADLTGEGKAAMACLGDRLDADAMARVRAVRTIEDAVREADLVIEAAPEDLETKLEVFTILDKTAPPRTIMATTAATLSVTEIASITLRGDHILGMRFQATLVEIVPGIETGEDALAAAEEVGRRMGKQTVRLKVGI